MMNSQFKLISRRITLLIFLITAIMATVPPIQYFHTERIHIKNILNIELSNAQDNISKFIYATPKTWIFQEDRLTVLIKDSEINNNTHDTWRVIDNKKNVIVNNKYKHPWLKIRDSKILYNGIIKVGIIEHSTSIVPKLIHTGYIAALSFLCALIIFFGLRTFVLYTIQEAYKRLELSLDELQKTKKELQITSY